MLTFNAMGLSPNLMKGIEDLGFKNPTPIQEKVIPVFFGTENDIIGLAQTGTGKTAAFGLPIIETIDIQNKRVQALVLSPTRELCIQITKDLQNYSKHINGLEIVAVYGGASIDLQIRALKRGAQIIVATPGRMLDLIKRKAANISNIKNVVLDEADEMLNMGFREELDNILETSPAMKRTLLFSATMPKEVANIAKNYMNNPEKITIGAKNSGAENVRHIYYQVHARNRYLALKRIADINPNIYGIVFCRTRMETKEVADKLIKDGYNADALHGDLSQAQRDHVMKRFRERTLQMLVATDVAARGIDVDDITHIINYNLPENAEAYIHRSGRTGRAGKSGVSIAIVNYREVNKIPQIEKFIHKKFNKVPVPSGNEICKKQLFQLIDRMENVEVDETQIAQFMETVNKKLEWLTKEQIIKRFLSLEFNRFLEYYKNAPDLNEKEDKRKDKNSRDSRSRDSRSRDGRSRDGRNRRDRDFGNRESNRSHNDRNNRKGQEGYTRFFLNVGKTDGVAPKNIIGMINDYTKDRDINIGAIDLKDKFSFFEVEEKHTSKILSSFKNNKYNGRSVRVEIAEKDNNTSNNYSGKRKERKRKNY
ncbi:MAG: DEAD/DEAH box helicase [Bacteroidales bacterium]|nr:DEAD/DEAH box helicase [Bacteroidales bacterium]